MDDRRTSNEPVGFLAAALAATLRSLVEPRYAPPKARSTLSRDDRERRRKKNRQQKKARRRNRK